ncbi:DEAD/DEAH box helicase [Streptomyces sp. H27-C3]|uniref:DEAD/DEAH box helicase n=1 Tax=Streptomyces sp. H27-C3 TaxID=3046305 RepID=UPI0024B95914|nr:DEAD/DEAH box helicase [Streptomyces sp. H27-C3]MDJ0463157.1 DEAD/DEAH box helicase [Streptomyces sp. H27-C3]
MFTGKLHPYQEQDVSRIVERGSMLCAYSMGMGKTVLSIAVVEEWLAQEGVTTCMVVVPASLKWQWAAAISRFTDVPSKRRPVGRAFIDVPDDSACIVVDGTKAQKEKQYQAILDTRPDYVVLSYENVVNDWRTVRKIRPDVLIGDEISYVKSFRAQRTKKIKRLTARYRLGLSGTVIDNGQPEELFSIFEWIDEQVLGRWDLFDRAFIHRSRSGIPVAYRNLPLLHTKISEAMIRRTYRDADVAPYMPKVKESVLPVRLGPRALFAYEQIAQDLLKELEKLGGSGSLDLAAVYAGRSDSGNTAQGRVMARLSALQMLINHPALLKDSARFYAAGEGGSKYAARLVDRGALDGVDSSPKLDAVVRYLKKRLMADDKLKVILFSFNKGVLPRVAAALAQWQAVYFTGDLNAKAKAEAKAIFASEPQVRLFLASDAGGYGLDLPEASLLINYDQRDSSGAMDQRNSRHVRASSLFAEVEVVNVVAEDTIEERRMERLAVKRRTNSAILDGRGADVDGRVVNDVESLRANLTRSLSGLRHTA